MSEYQEFTGKTVEEALRNAREAFGATGLDDLDFEILTPGSRGVLGMGAEPARIIAAPRAALGGAAPRREAAAATPLPPPVREERFGDRDGDRGRGRDFGRDRDRGRGRERGDFARPTRDDRPAGEPGPASGGSRPPYGEPGRRSGEPRQPRGDLPASGEPPTTRPDVATSPTPVRERYGAGRREGRLSDRRDDPHERAGRPAPSGALTQRDQAELATARASSSAERDEIQAAEASPEALAAGQEILERLLGAMGYQATVTIHSGETSKLDVTGEGDEKEALGALIGRKGERLSALQHLVNLMLSKRMGAWTRVLVDVEDYRGRRERQLLEIAQRAAERVIESGAMLQLEPMPALERRWVHLALRNHSRVTTQSIGEEPQRRVVIIRRD